MYLLLVFAKTFYPAFLFSLFVSVFTFGRCLRDVEYPNETLSSYFLYIYFVKQTIQWRENEDIKSNPTETSFSPMISPWSPFMNYSRVWKMLFIMQYEHFSFVSKQISFWNWRMEHYGLVMLRMWYNLNLFVEIRRSPWEARRAVSWWYCYHQIT